jgi:hypothetical protein
VLSLLQEEGGEVHLLLQPPFLGHHPHQGQEVQGHGLLPAQEEAGEPEEKVLGPGVQGLVGGPVLGKVQGRGVPEKALGLVVNWTYAVLKIPDKMGLKMFPYGKAAGD